MRIAKTIFAGSMAALALLASPALAKHSDTPESRREAGCLGMHGVPAGCRWIMEAAAMQGRRFWK